METTFITLFMQCCFLLSNLIHTSLDLESFLWTVKLMFSHITQLYIASYFNFCFGLPSGNSAIFALPYSPWYRKAMKSLLTLTYLFFQCTCSSSILEWKGEIDVHNVSLQSLSGILSECSLLSLGCFWHRIGPLGWHVCATAKPACTHVRRLLCPFTTLVYWH